MVIDTLPVNVVHSRSYNDSKNDYSSFPHMDDLNFQIFFFIYLSKSYYYIFSIFTINFFGIGR